MYCRAFDHSAIYDVELDQERKVAKSQVFSKYHLETSAIVILQTNAVKKDISLIPMTFTNQSRQYGLF